MTYILIKSTYSGVAIYVMFYMAIVNCYPIKLSWYIDNPKTIYVDTLIIIQLAFLPFQLPGCRNSSCHTMALWPLRVYFIKLKWCSKSCNFPADVVASSMVHSIEASDLYIRKQLEIRITRKCSQRGMPIRTATWAVQEDLLQLST